MESRDRKNILLSNVHLDDNLQGTVGCIPMDVLVENMAKIEDPPVNIPHACNGASLSWLGR